MKIYGDVLKRELFLFVMNFVVEVKMYNVLMNFFNVFIYGFVNCLGLLELYLNIKFFVNVEFIKGGC